MAKEYYSLLTKAGQAKIANASLLNTKLEITTIKLGDGNGAEYNPTEEQTDLKRVVYTGKVSAVRKDPELDNVIIIESVIPQSAGNFMIREIGYYDAEGDLVLVAKYKSQFKPQVSSNGAAVDMKVNTVIAVSNAENVELKIDNTLIFATSKDVEKLRQEMSEKIGNLSSLKTTDNTNVVAAINEIFLKFDDISTDAKGTSFDDAKAKLGADNVQVAIEKTVEKVNTTNTNLDNLKKKIKENRTVVASTLTASKWQGNTYSFETEYPHAQYDIAIELGENATLEQAYAFADACLKGSIGTQVITALDIVPTIDIPITIEVLKKWE